MVKFTELLDFGKERAESCWMGLLCDIPVDLKENRGWIESDYNMERLKEMHTRIKLNLIRDSVVNSL